jgi:hypothetical protein
MDEAHTPALSCSYGKLAANGNRLTYGHESFEIADVESLTYFRKATQHRVNFAPAGTDHECTLEIYLRGRPKPISVYYTGAKLSVMLENTKKKADALTQVYDDLAAATWEQRLAKYVNALQSEGMFRYDDKIIHQDGTVSDGKETQNLLDTMLIRNPFTVELYQPYSKSFWKRQAQKWKGVGIFIVTATDGDCFISILRDVFGIRWKENSGTLYGFTESNWAKRE